jgi:hypothetical protein
VYGRGAEKGNVPGRGRALPVPAQESSISMVDCHKAILHYFDVKFL